MKRFICTLFHRKHHTTEQKDTAADWFFGGVMTGMTRLAYTERTCSRCGLIRKKPEYYHH